MDFVSSGQRNANLVIIIISFHLTDGIVIIVFDIVHTPIAEVLLSALDGLVVSILVLGKCFKQLRGEHILILPDVSVPLKSYFTVLSRVR